MLELTEIVSFEVIVSISEVNSNRKLKLHLRILFALKFKISRTKNFQISLTFSQRYQFSYPNLDTNHRGEVLPRTFYGMN